MEVFVCGENMYIRISSRTLSEIIANIVYSDCKTIGIIGTTGNNIIDYFYFDADAETSEYSCSLCPGAFEQVSGKAALTGIGRTIHYHGDSCGRGAVSVSG